MTGKPPLSSRALIHAATGCVLFLAALLATPPARSQSDPGDGPHATMSLVSETRGVAPGQTLQLALRQQIAPGWHTYWVNPGDSGLPTTLDWTLPPGFSAGAMNWPTPQRIAYGPLMSFGYEGETLVPVAVTAPPDLKPGATATLSGHASWLACADVCVPEDADIAISLPVVAGAAAADPQWRDAIETARAALPTENPFTTSVTANADTITLTVATGDAARLADIAFYPLDQGTIDNNAPQQVRTGRSGLVVTMRRGDLKTRPFAQLNGVLAFRDESTGGAGINRAITIASPVGAPAAGDAAGSGVAAAPLGGVGLLEALLLAIGGGAILNLMPCVLPVLSIKALGLVRHAQAAPREVRMQGLAYAAGVLISFALVAGALIALRSAGAEIGWGFQLQSPIFLTIMIYVLFAVGLSLSGVFSFGDSVAGLGSGLAARAGYSGSFFTGALATLVATPCTAPFMAAAIGFAITQPWYVSLAVFEAIGAGLALPYMLLAFSPGLRRFLPRPGAWMDRLKQLLAFPVYGTAVWLAFVLASEGGSVGVTAALTGLVLIAFAAWLYETVRLGEGWGRRAALCLSALAVAGALGLLSITDDAAPAAAAQTARDGWQPFTGAKLASLRAEGKPVFVDFTADWCITCKVNERVALGDDAVRRAFAAQGVVALRGDWTRRDTEITRILEANGRGGVPLYLYYPKGGDAIILPQILTADTVLEHLQGG
jgi:thiol:disulfide interchange protein DsbD